MKPIIIIEYESYDYDPEKAKEIDDHMAKLSQSHLKDYDILVMWGGKAKVYYPCKPISFYYQKLKVWLFLKIWKKNIS
jgi:hypothetical protein